MVYLKFAWTLLLHKWYVLRAGLFVGVPLWRLVVHDWSKFTLTEFARYARNFRGDYSTSPVDRDQVSLEFTYAWLHHENRNQHHWGYWIPRSGQSANKPLPMPKASVREMIADFMGASKAYTGKWDIAAWLNKNGPRWSVHLETEQLIAVIMTEIGYLGADDCSWSWTAGSKFMEWSNDD